MGFPRTREKVLQAFVDHGIGNLITVRELEHQTGLTKHQILTAVGNLRRDDGVAIEVVTQGAAWIYRGTAKTNDVPKSRKGSLFEYLAQTKSGAILVQDENGTVYSLTELE